MSVTSIENLPVSHRFNPGVCGFENLRHLIVDSIRIGSENGLKPEGILEAVRLAKEKKN